MKIHEVMTVTGLTKKAINYYARQGLISPFIDVDNNYRDFNSDDVIRLKQISALREFDMPVKEIKEALLSRENFANALNLYSHKLKDRIINLEHCENILTFCLCEMKSEFPDMEKVTDNMIFLKKSLLLTEKGRKDFICKELQRIFPGSFGKVISLKLSYFLYDITLDEIEKQDAWLRMVDQLDQCPDLSCDKNFEDFIESENINWEKIERTYIDRMEKFNGQEAQDVLETMWDLSDFHFTDEEMKWYEIELYFLRSKENISHLKDIYLKIGGDLAILSPKYKKYQDSITQIGKKVGEKLQQPKKPNDEPAQDIQIVSLPEITFIGLEYKRILSFEEVCQSVNTFKEKVNRGSFGNVEEIFVVKGIGSLPQYKASNADSFQIKFSLIVGIPAANGGSLPAGMKAFTVPPHTYATYHAKINSDLKNLIDDELPIINHIAQQYKPSKFPILECYHGSDRPFVEVFMPIDFQLSITQ